VETIWCDNPHHDSHPEEKFRRHMGELFRKEFDKFQF